MCHSTQSEPTRTPSPKPHNPYARMSQRRAIACTICAKAKTKCDKAVPSCSRCTAKGLQCEPRSTRRTSDNSYRKPSKHLVSPKRYSASSSSPRSVPASSRPQFARTLSQMDFHTAAKLAQQPANFNFNMLTPLPPFTPQIVDECYSYSSSPEGSMHGFPMSMEKSYMSSRSGTPGTPDSFPSYEALPISDAFDPYMNNASWNDDGSIPIGLGFENDMPNMMANDMWGTIEWSQQLAMSPPQAAPSLSLSECSSDEFISPLLSPEQWTGFQPNAGQMMGKPIVTRQAYPTAPQPIWEDIIMPRPQRF